MSHQNLKNRLEKWLFRNATGENGSRGRFQITKISFFCQALLNVSERYIGNSEYFNTLKTEIDNGGLEAMLHYLQNKDISDFNVRVIPKTTGLTKQKLLSLDSVQLYWYQKLQEGELLSGYVWGAPVPTRALYDDYVSGAQKLGGNTRRVSSTSFGMNLSKLLPDGWPKKTKKASSNGLGRTHYYTFPSKKTCKRAFETVLGGVDIEWE